MPHLPASPGLGIAVGLTCRDHHRDVTPSPCRGGSCVGKDVCKYRIFCGLGHIACSLPFLLPFVVLRVGVEPRASCR